MKLSLSVFFALLTGFATTVKAQNVALEDGLRLHLNFNANLTDLSSSVANGSLKGALYGEDRFGNCEYALCFREYLQLAELDASAVRGLQDFSLSLWFRKDVTAFGTILSVANPNRDNELNLNVGANGLISSNIRNLPNIPGIAIVGSTDLNDGQWHHVVLTREAAGGGTYIYVDKQEDAFKIMPLGDIEVSGGGFVLGNDQDCVASCYAVAQQFYGVVDDLRIYDRVISQDEINSLFDFVDGQVDNSIRGTSRDLTTCQEQVTIEIERDFESYVWNTGSTDRSIQVTEDGQYIVTGLVKNCEYSDTVNVVINTLPLLSISANETELACFGDIIIEATPGFDEYIWQDGSRGSTYDVTNTGIYQVRGVSSCGEVISNSIEIVQSPLFSLEITSDAPRIGCGETVVLMANEGFTDYRWSNGQTGPELVVSSPGIYEVTALDICGDLKRASLKIDSDEGAPYFIPNTFTPNGDGKNEKFEIDARLVSSSLTVVSRWGDKVYENLSYQNDWGGEGVNSGVYYYLISGPCLEEPIKGWLKVIR